MNILILDCSAGMNVILLKGDSEYSFIDETQKKHSDDILCVIDELLSQANLTISQIDNICVCVGPGSFTGVRVAISVCKGLAIGTDAKVFVLSNLETVNLEKYEKSILILEGFSDFVYVRIKNKSLEENKCININQLKEIIENEKYNVFTLAEKTQIRLKNIEINAKIIKKQTKNIFIEKIKNNEYVDINKISPIYLRASQAEIERNKKLNGEN